jgi:hypothetical protein
MTYAAMRPDASQAKIYGEWLGARPAVVKTTEGERWACRKSAKTIAMTPRISSTTPVLLTMDMRRTPMMFTVVVIARRMIPRSTAFAAPVLDTGEESAADPPTSWKPDHTAGRTACSAIAAVATVTICPTIMTHPVNHPNVAPASRPAHWKIAPEMGHRAARVEKLSATRSWPANTSGQVQKNAAPPRPNPRKKSWKTVVRIETNENPAAKEPNGPTLRWSSCTYPKPSRSSSSLVIAEVLSVAFTELLMGSVSPVDSSDNLSFDR